LLKIYQDEIDILIDLDSITLDITCEIMALKPAPIQVTWLGWDAEFQLLTTSLLILMFYLSLLRVLHRKKNLAVAPNIAVDGFEVGCRPYAAINWVFPVMLWCISAQRATSAIRIRRDCKCKFSSRCLIATFIKG